MLLAHPNKMKSLRLTTSKHLPPVKPSPFLPPLFPNSLARLPKRSGSSTLTRRFETTGPRQGLRVYARFVQQRLVTVPLQFLVRLLKCDHGSPERRRGGGQKEVVSYLLSTASFTCPSMYAYALKALGVPQITNTLSHAFRSLRP